MDIRKEAELRVLRHLIENKDEMIPDGMEEHEYKAACYRLEEKHCVQLARIYGGFEGIRILDEGYVYLKELGIEEKKEASEIERLKTENAKLKAISGKKEYQHSLFEKTQKFVEDTQYFCNVIQSKEFYDHNGYFYQQTKKRYDSYCDVNEDELVKEVNNSPLQTYFDDFKKLLNSIVIPNYDTMSMRKFIQENLTSDRELLEDALEIFETVVEKCGYLRNSVESFMELYDLKDNSPKSGFLRPLFIDEVLREEDDENCISGGKETSIVENKGKTKLGRPKAKAFEEFIKRDAPQCFLSILEEMLDGKSGIAAARIIHACIGYWIDIPTNRSVVDKFDSVKSTSFNTAMKNSSNFSDEVITEIRAEIERKISEKQQKK
jgi:hypothetical protein